MAEPLLIRDITIGGAFQRFDTTDDGYREANEFIKEIFEQGHQPAGDVTKVLKAVGQTPRLQSNSGFGW